MRSFFWTVLALATCAQAQSIVTICNSYSYTATSTFTEYETFYVMWGSVGEQPMTRTTSDGFSNGGIGNSRTTSTSTTQNPASDNVPGNGTSVVIPDNTIVPTTPIPTSLTTTSSTTVQSSSTSVTIGTTSSNVSQSSNSIRSSMSTSVDTSTTTSAGSSSSSTTTDLGTSTTTGSSTSDSSSTTTSQTSTTSDSTTTTAVTTSTTSSQSSTSSTSTSTGSTPIVTNQAYIDTILRHHAQHRLNHTADALTWNADLAATAKKISDSCIYKHDTATDCPTGACYGQNIAAGYLPTQMSFLISDGFYNSEVNSYTYYGGEPDLTTLHSWGHFSQIVWKIDTNSVGCYTMDCTASGLTFPNGGGAGIRPFFTVCNYGGPGNWVGEFKQNVIQPVGLDSIHAGYKCPTLDNCEDKDTVG